MDGSYGWASGEMMIAADVDPYEQEIMKLQKELEDTKAHRDGALRALGDLRKACVPIITITAAYSEKWTEFAKVYNATAANGCCPSCDRCLCVDAHPGCGCVDCGGTGYYSG